jgi:hypothetical protein
VVGLSQLLRSLLDRPAKGKTKRRGRNGATAAAARA